MKNTIWVNLKKNPSTDDTFRWSFLGKLILGTTVVVLHFPFTSSIMIARRWRDITMQNSQVGRCTPSILIRMWSTMISASRRRWCLRGSIHSCKLVGGCIFASNVTKWSSSCALISSIVKVVGQIRMCVRCLLTHPGVQRRLASRKNWRPHGRWRSNTWEVWGPTACTYCTT